MSKERSGRVAAPEPARNCRPPKPLGGLLPGACSVVDRHAEFYSRGGLRSLLDAAPGAIAVGPCARLARRRRPWRRWRRARIHCATMPTGLWLARYRRPRPHKYAVVKISHGWIKPHVQCPVNQTETAQCANLCRLVDRSHAGVKPLPTGPWRSASYVSAQRHLDVQTFDRYRTSALLPQTPIIQHTRIIARSCMTDASP